MVKLNWDAVVNKIRQIIFLHNMRSLSLQQKIILLNTFIIAKVWYLSSILPPQCIHTAKLTAAMGNFLFRGLAARVPMQQLARSREKGGLKLQLPAIKCKALLINRHLQEIDSLPFYQSLLAQNIPAPADLPCLRLLSQQLPLLPQIIQQIPSSDRIHCFFLEQTDAPRVERNFPGIAWKRIWLNIAAKQLSSYDRSDLYLFINEKTEHRRLMNIVGRTSDPNCQLCAVVETLAHKFSECPRVEMAWEYVQRKITTILGGWQRLTFDDLQRPILDRCNATTRNQIFKILVIYIRFINGNVNIRIDVNELEFLLSLEG